MKLYIKDHRNSIHFDYGYNDYTDFLVLPVKETFALDDSLDNVTLTLTGTTKKHFRMFTLVKLSFEDEITGVVPEDKKNQYFYIAQDNSTKIIGTNKYKHEIMLIEETKLLEKYVIDSCTVTQPLLTEFTRDTSLIVPIRSGSTFNLATLNEYQKIRVAGDTIMIVRPRQIQTSYQYLDQTSYCKVYENNKLLVTLGVNDTIELRNLKGGTVWSLKYHLEGTSGSLTATEDVEYNFAVIPNNTSAVKISVTDAVNKLLAIATTKRTSETIGISFNTTQATYYSNIEATEFSFTRSTLRDALDQIAGCYNCITALKNGVVYFEEVSMTPTETNINFRDYLSFQTNQDIEQYCAEIDTIAENLVKTSKGKRESIVSPYTNGYLSVRTETIGARIDEDSAIILLDRPVEKITKLVLARAKLSDGTELDPKDLTKYLYEEVDYNTLSSYSGIYPYSKGYALYYTQGENSIKGLTFKLPNALFSILERPAIVNIMEKEYNRSVQDLFNVQSLTQLLFRVEYVPIVSARIKQSKGDLRGYNEKFESAYNQSANKIDAYAYGENLKGAVNRLGNIEEIRTYVVKKDFPIYEIDHHCLGKTIDGLIISSTQIELMKNYKKVTFYLTKDFNRKNRYIGIKNNIRMYEVSEKQVSERFVVYEDFCIIGDNFGTVEFEEFAGYDTGLITEAGIVAFSTEFRSSSPKNVTFVRAKGIDKNNEDLTSMDLSVVSVAIGNSMCFTFEYADNYSAGPSSEEATTSTGNEYYRVQTYAPYGDYYGRIENLSFNIYESRDAGGAYNNVKEYADSYPISIESSASLNGNYFTTSGNFGNIVIKKDNREKISFTYQINFISNWDNLIIGSALARCNPLIAKNDVCQGECKLVIFQQRLNKYDDEVTAFTQRDIKTIQHVYDYYSDTEDKTITFNDQEVSVTLADYAWGIVKVVDGKRYLLFGMNFDTPVQSSGFTILMPTLNFVHRWSDVRDLINYNYEDE